MIPKILHFTWKTEQLPRPMQRYFDAWRRLHPDWEIRLWTDETMRTFVSGRHPEFLSTYDGYAKGIQRADAFRYLVLGALGGVYADLDVEPFRPITPLLQHHAFLGIEPLEHIGADRLHQGVPFLLTNAFMGSVPGHRLWREIIERMPRLSGLETFYATGPSMVTAAVLRLPREERPALLAPNAWSPLLSDGRRTRRDDEAIELLTPVAEVVRAGGGPFVSHVWMSTWVTWHKRRNRLNDVLQLPTVAKWAARRMANPAFGSVVIADPAEPYTDQTVVSAVEQPVVQIAVRLGGAGLSDDLARALAGLDYPKTQTRLTVHVRADIDRDAVGSALARVGLSATFEIVREESAAGRDHGVLERMLPDAEFLLLVDGAVRSIPPEALRLMLGAGRPVVAANVVDAAGEPADPQLFRYEKGAPFKVLYKDGGQTGTVRGDRGFRTYPGQQKSFAVLPLDGVGESFVLIARPVVEAGVRFAETPYKLHLGAEAFGIMARDRGFEACVLTELDVVRAGG